MSEFDPFQRLTSVHVNSTDDHMLASGYTFGVRLFDIETKQVQSTLFPFVSHDKSTAPVPLCAAYDPSVSTFSVP